MKTIMLVGFTKEQHEELKKLPASFISADETDAIEKVKTAHALVGLNRDILDKIITDDLIKTGKNLEWIHAAGAGVDKYLVPELVKSSIIFTNGKIIQGPHVADHALALLLSLTRNIHHTLRKTQSKRPIELRKKTALIVGCGGVGMLIAERAAGFGMTIHVVDEVNIPYMGMIDKFYLPEQLEEALKTADVIFISAALTKRSKNIIGSKEFAAIKPNAYFINVARGGLVDTDALTKAAPKFAGIGLDVTEPEPLPENHPFKKMPNVIITDHIAGLSDVNHIRRWEHVKTNIEHFIKGLPLLNQVDKELGH